MSKDRKKSKLIGLSTRLSICLPAIATAILFGIGFVSSSNAETSKNVLTLSLVSAWTSPDFGNYGVEKFINRINTEAKTVKIDFKGGAEVIPPLDGFMYVSRGTVSLYHTAATYYAGSVPEAMAAFVVKASLRSLRESGFWKLYDEMHRKKGVTVLSMLWRGGTFGLFLNKPITTANLNGLKIRSLPMYESFLRKLEASTVNMPQGDIYTGLEKGVVDGFCYPYGPGFMEKSWHEVVKYVVSPPIPYENSGPLLANLKEWEALPEETRKEIMDAILSLEDEIYKWYTEEAPKYIRKAIDQGLIKETILTPKEAEIFTNTATAAMWEDILKRSPENGAKLKELGAKAEMLEKQRNQ